MNTQPEALRLADLLEQIDGQHWQVQDSAATELRRLHEAHDWQYRMAGERLRRVEKLEAQRDALLEALRLIAGLITHPEARQKALDAIAKVEENT